MGGRGGGNVYVRMLLIHGARAQARWLDRRKKRGLADTPLDRWLDRLMRRKHPNVAVVALAHRLARGAHLGPALRFSWHGAAPPRRIEYEPEFRMDMGQPAGETTIG